MCNCKVCVYGRLVEENLVNLPEPQRIFFEDMYERLCDVEFDNSYCKAVLDGSWPSAHSVLTAALTKCKGDE